MFPQLTDYLHANNLSVAAVKEVATSHLTALSKHFKSYFVDVNTDAWDWVRDPFAPGVTCSGLTSKAEDELVDLSCDRTLKARFQQSAHYSMLQVRAEVWDDVHMGRLIGVTLVLEDPSLTRKSCLLGKD
ncbi:unnamed protein product [Boreogadus saida]